MWRQTIYPTRDGSYVYFDTTFFLVITSICLLVVWLLKKAKEPYEQRARLIELAAKLPGPPTLPIIGNALQFACSSEETLDRINEIVRNYDSPMRVWLGPKLFVILTEPRDYEIILGCQKASHKDPVYRFMEPFVGKGLVSGSGPVHRSHRKVIMPMLNSKALNAYVQHFDNHSRIFIDLLEDKVGCEAFDIQPYLTHCTVDMIFDTILGIAGNSQTDGHKELVYWTETMYELIHVRMMKVWLHPDWIFHRTALGARQNEGQKVIRSFIESAVARKKKEHFALERGAITSDRARLALLEQIIDCSVKRDFMSDDQIRDEIYTLFTAAQDTTAVISSFALLNLAMNQGIQNKVRQEIATVLGNESVTVERLSELRYTEMVIKETLRLYPIAPLMVRRVTGDIDLETCTLPKGCSIVMLPYKTHRSDKFWQDPERFIPERFLPENTNTRHPYAYIPFSGGLRGCIGQKYAIMCLKTLLAHVVRRYRLTTTQTQQTLRLKTDISIRSRDGYMVKIEKI